MRYRVAKKIIQHTNAGASYRPKTYAKAYRIIMRRVRRYYPAYYANLYYSQKTTRDLNDTMKANGLDYTFDVQVVIAQEAA
jgi:hypothetical protein